MTRESVHFAASLAAAGHDPADRDALAAALPAAHRRNETATTAQPAKPDGKGRPTPTRKVHERLEPYAQDAIELFYEVGQLIADPTLAKEPPAPGEDGGAVGVALAYGTKNALASSLMPAGWPETAVDLRDAAVTDQERRLVELGLQQVLAHYQTEP